MANILVVDDDRDLRALLKTALEREGHLVTALPDGRALAERHCRWADLILLDVMMPGEDGVETCRRVRGLTDAPILFLTAKTAEADVLTALGAGGDDCLAKPFRVAELRARVGAHLRRQQRTPGGAARRIGRGGVVFDLLARTAAVGGGVLPLTKGEYAICEYLALHAGQTFGKEQIYEAVFGFDATGDESAVTEHIKNIRAKFRAAALTPDPIETVWGMGYRWRRAEGE